ncbi:hypothetical protein [endosymbiont GvMRE of Glomus versiforme]|uniref:hypothetical protein n=1 Tax=endosymbiont GvMRE of Glomus versiforme TaxID=2039283 RepID=UPI0011C3BF86|nr:hypothetical protein [endosymbiont GvMRE of Glomus versiforme]
MKDLTKLKWLDISKTNIKEGLEYLPESCKEIYCELDYNYGSVEIAKELSKFSEENEESEHTKYNLNKWRIDKANNTTASIIPLERLFVIRGNIKQFLNKWGKKVENDIPELSKLQEPTQYSKYRYLGGVKWIARATAVTGGILALNERPTEGGILAATSPFVDAIAAHIEDNYYTAREIRWKEFLTDADMLLDNYHELLGIIKKLGTGSELGKVNKALKDLDTKAKEFLKIYDTDGNEEIDISELITKRQVLTQDLTKNNKESKLQLMVEAIKHLEDIVVAYQKNGSLIEEEKEKQESLETKLAKIKEKLEKIKNEEPETQLNNYHQVKNQVEEQRNLLSQKEQLTDAESELLKEITELMPIIEEKINNIKNDAEKKLMQDKFFHLENQIRNLVSASYWGNKISQGWEYTKQGTSNAIDYLKDSLTTPVWYWEQWKERKPLINVNETEQLLSSQSENQQESIDEGIKLSSQVSLLNKYQLENSASEELAIEMQSLENKEWQNQNFTQEQTKQWIEVGLTANEANFATWLRDIKSKDLVNFANPQWIKEKIATKDLDLNELRQAYEQESQEIKIDMQAQVIQPPKGGNN